MSVLITSALKWLELREILNLTAREYPAQPELVAFNLRNLMFQVPALVAAHEQLQSAAQQRM